LVQQESAAGKNVRLVFMSNITPANLFDEVHPDPSAYATMAANWYSAILEQQPDVGGTPGGTVNTISSLVVSAVGGSGNDLLMGNSKPARLRQSRFLGDPRFCQLPECMAPHPQLSRSHPAS
jgi:hypothetical protein